MACSLCHPVEQTMHSSIPTPASAVSTTTAITTIILQLSGTCLGQPGCAGGPVPEETHIVVINHPLSASSIFYNPWHPPCSIYVTDSLFPQSFSKFPLVYLLAWQPSLHTPYISSLNHCLQLVQDPCKYFLHRREGCEVL